MKLNPALGPPPGLEHPCLQQQGISSPEEYSVGDEIFALRSNGSWSPGTVTKIDDEKVTVALKEGVKQIRKDKVHAFLQKKDSPLPLKQVKVMLREAQLASEKAALQVENASLVMESMMMRKNVDLQAENARLAKENMMMRMNSQSMTPMYDPCAMQDPHGYMSNPWGIPQLACPSMCEDGNIPNSWSKIGAKKASEDSWGSVSTATGGSSWGQSFAGNGEPETRSALSHTLPHERTTMMMRNIPNNFSREQLLALVDDEGFRGQYDLLYLPIDLKKKVGLGYAFVNFVKHEDAEAFAEHFRGFKNWKTQSEKVCELTWSDALQGLDEHVERYRDCPVMHESIPDEFKPVLFKDGVRMPFPGPTKKIRAPRPWCRR